MPHFHGNVTGAHVHTDGLWAATLAIVSVAPTATGATVAYVGAGTHYRVNGGAIVALPASPFTFSGLAPNSEPNTVELSSDGGSTWTAPWTFGTLNPGSGGGELDPSLIPPLPALLGSAAAALGPAGSSAFGAIAVAGAAAAGFASVGSGSVGAVSVLGGALVQLLSPPAGGAIVVGAAPVSGGAAAVLGPASFTLTAAVTVAGGAAAVLAPVAAGGAASTGLAPIAGSSVTLLGAAGSNASGTVAVQGSAAVVLLQVEAVAAGGRLVLGGAEATLGAVSSVALGTVANPPPVLAIAARRVLLLPRERRVLRWPAENRIWRAR